MPRSRPPYPPEFRAEAVRLARSSESRSRRSPRKLGVSAQTLRNWVFQAGVDAGEAEGLKTDERATRRLVAQLERLEVTLQEAPLAA